MSLKKIISIFIILLITNNYLFSQTISATIKGGTCDSCLIIFVKSAVNAKVAINNMNLTISVVDTYNPVLSIKNDSMLTEGHHLNSIDFDYSGKQGSTLASYVVNGRRYYDIIYHNNSSESSNDSTILLANIEHPVAEIKIAGLNNHSLVEAKVQCNDMSTENGGNNMQSYWYASIAGNGNDGEGTISSSVPAQMYYSASDQNIIGSNAANDQYIQLTNFIKALPLNFITIAATHINDKNIITWSVDNDADTKEYFVQRSSNGINFQDLILVKKKSNQTNYNCTDNLPFNGNNFYRIKSIGITGQIIYSPIASVGSEINEQIAIYPNPINDDGFNIQFENAAKGLYHISIYDMSGKQLFQESFSNQSSSLIRKIQLSKKLSKGNYKVNIIKPDNSTLPLNMIY